MPDHEAARHIAHRMYVRAPEEEYPGDESGRPALA